MADDPAYRDYLQRFDAAVGPADTGAYAKWKGHLIRKLGPDEFAARDAEYRALCESFESSVIDGKTLDNLLIRQLRERAAELVVPSPV